MAEIIFLSPEFQERIWGGERLKTYFGYDIPSSKTGECWAVSAHHHGDCIVATGTYSGKTLSWLWKNHKELFGNIKGDRFPLLTKIIDAKDDLSVQVHPNDEYAYNNENGELGKTECWYIIACDEEAELIIGHHAQSKQEMIQFTEEGKWNDLLRRVKIQPGDFFYIPAGTIHAIGKGTMILETQQSSDVTYRVFDYDRLQDGKPRELHLSKSVDVAMIPHQDYSNSYKTKALNNAVIKHLVQAEYFSVSEIRINGIQSFTNNHPFQIFSVIEGEGSIDGIAVKKGDHFILPSGYKEFSMDGMMKLITSHV